jgi:AsmA family protein
MALRPGTFRDLRADVRMRDGALVIDPLEARLATGGMQGRMRLRQQEAGAEFDVRLIASGLSPADLGIEEDMIRGGETDLFIDLQARGRSSRELANSISGEMALAIAQAVIENEMVDVLGADVVAEAIRYINPFIEREPRTELRCAAAHIVASDGVLFSDDHVVLETSQVTVRASGVVDLRDASLEIDFEPEASEGFDIGIADVADLVRVRGSLTAPEVELDPEGVAEAAVTLGAAIATAGVSLVVQGLFEGDGNGTPCGQIFAAQPQDHGDMEQEEG